MASLAHVGVDALELLIWVASLKQEGMAVSELLVVLELVDYTETFFMRVNKTVIVRCSRADKINSINNNNACRQEIKQTFRP